MTRLPFSLRFSSCMASTSSYLPSLPAIVSNTANSAHAMRLYDQWPTDDGLHCLIRSCPPFITSKVRVGQRRNRGDVHGKACMAPLVVVGKQLHEVQPAL